MKLWFGSSCVLDCIVSSTLLCVGIEGQDGVGMCS